MMGKKLLTFYHGGADKTQMEMTKAIGVSQVRFPKQLTNLPPNITLANVILGGIKISVNFENFVDNMLKNC